MRQWIPAVVTFWACAALSGCGTPMHAEMLGESIKLFTTKTAKTGGEKVWIAGPNDSACDMGCQNGCGVGGGKAMTSGLSRGGAGSRYDGLAYEVFANYLTQKHKMRVIESHRHNYATETGVETHKKLEVLNDQGKLASTTSCEDLCLLDEAKKRRAEKVLVFHILEIRNEEMKIHFRLSDVATGVVEAAQTIKVMGLRAFDASPATINEGKGRKASAPPPSAADGE